MGVEPCIRDVNDLSRFSVVLWRVSRATGSWDNWSLVGRLLGARYVDILYFKGRTADGEPASMADWRRYAVRVGIVSVGLWLIAHAIVIGGTLLAGP